MRINAVIIGAQKCGTTAIRHNLERHPDVYMARKEEPPYGELHFFDLEKNWARGLEWYRSHFPHPELMQGEKTPDYLSHSICHKRMYATVPNARLIIMLRNPVDRAYSAWNHFNQEIELSGQRGWKIVEFEQALEQGVRNPKGIFAKLFTKGLYGAQINSLLQFYPRDQIHMMITERLYRAPEEEYQKVLNFLGLGKSDELFGSRHVRSYPQPMRPETRILLERFYQPHNELLFKILGERIPEWSTVG